MGGAVSGGAVSGGGRGSSGGGVRVDPVPLTSASYQLIRLGERLRCAAAAMPSRTMCRTGPGRAQITLTTDHLVTLSDQALHSRHVTSLQDTSRHVTALHDTARHVTARRDHTKVRTVTKAARHSAGLTNKGFQLR